MNSQTEEFSNQLNQDIASVIATSTDYLTQIKDLKAKLSLGLGDVEITYNPQTNQPLSKAVLEIFGEETPSKQDKNLNLISLDMYVFCINILQQGGKYKAASILADKVF